MVVALVWCGHSLSAQGVPAPVREGTDSSESRGAKNSERAADVSAGPLPAHYVIGAEDVLAVNFWRDADMTGDVTVRPDGRITLPLLGEFQAAGLTPDALNRTIKEAASKLFEDPTVTVSVREIKSRKVFITGNVATPGAHALTRELTVMQLIAMAGGLTEFADKKNISIIRNEVGQQRTFKLNYSDVAKGKRLEQNLSLKPGDTVIVP
jgi:polysaccharide export outer membrane protein